MKYFYKSKNNSKLKECKEWEIPFYEKYGYIVVCFNGRKVI